MRQNTSWPKLPESPHSSEAIVKITIEAKKSGAVRSGSSHGVIEIAAITLAMM